MNLRAVVLAVGLGVLTGCAAPQISMTKQVQTNIEKVQGTLEIPQNNLDVTVQATNPGNTGLIGALVATAIDSARQSSAEKEAAPILNSLRDYDFRVVMLKASNDALTQIDKLKFDIPLRVDQVSSDSARRIAFDQSTASAVLFCKVGYRLEHGRLIVNATAEMYPKVAALKAFRAKPDESNPLSEGNAIYRKTFTSVKQAITPNNVQASLSEAAANVARQLAADLNHGI